MKKTSLLLGASLLLPVVAFAAPNYNYIQGDYIIDGDLETAIGQSSDHYDGWNAKFSGALLPHVLVQGEHREIEINNGNGDQDFTSIAVGGFLGLSDEFDAFGTVGYELLNDEVDASGYSVNLGLRILPSKHFEISPFVGWVDYGQLENVQDDPNFENADLSGLRYGVEMIFSVTDCLGITASYRQTELNLDNVNLGAAGNRDNIDVEFNDEFRIGVRLYL